MSLRASHASDLVAMADGLRGWLHGDVSVDGDAAASAILEVFVMLREVLRDKQG